MKSLIPAPILIFLAITINALLFLLIHQLVSNEIISLPRLQELNWVDFIQLEQRTRPQEEQTRSRTPEEPPPPEKLPALPELKQPDISRPEQPAPDIPAPNIDIPMIGGGIPFLGDYLKSSPPAKNPGLTLDDIATDILPTTRIEPVYPPRALRSGIEGSVTVEFTISTDGSVKDLEIVSADPPDIFDRAVLNAVKRWKFTPEQSNGIPVERRARQDIKFTLKK